MQYTFRPLNWDLPVTPDHLRRPQSTFKAPWSDTLSLLARELDHLDARRVVLEVDFREQDLRIDGMPRSNARQPVFPGVRVAFDSKHGPLVYATDAHQFWQHNVRAIGLGLQALRAVDRYGVTRRGEQYQGYRAIGSTIAAPSMTVDQAARFVAEHGGTYREAAKRLHPDTGGDPVLFQRLTEAQRILTTN